MPAGRPTKYKKEFCEELIAHMAEGNSFETFAAIKNVNTDSLYEWEKRYPEFSDAKKSGIVKSLQWFENVGRAGMVGKIKGFVPSVYIFIMKCRFKQFGYRDFDVEQLQTIQTDFKVEWQK